jgi:hypothetical protein
MRFDFRDKTDLVHLFDRPARLYRPGVAAPNSAPQAAPRLRHPSLRLLEAVMTLAGERAELMCHAERPWASATFSGTRHTFTLSFPGEDGARAAEEFIETLSDHEFIISGQLVADAGISEVTQTTLPHRAMMVEADILLLDDL